MLTLPYFFVLRLRAVFLCVCLGGLSALAAQSPEASDPAGARGGSIASAADEWPSLVIGFIGQSRYQPQAAAAFAGATDAARELGPKHRMHVTVVHRSPEAATAAAQNEALRKLFVGDTAGVLINPVDVTASAPLLALLNRQRMPVVTLGTTAVVEGISAAVVDDENAIGQALAAEAFRLLDGRSGRRGGGIALLAGPQGLEPYSVRARAALESLQRSPSYAVYGEFYCEPTLTAALQMLRQVTARERDERLNAWISVGGWPLLGYHTDLPEANALAGFIVADGLPQMLPHLEQGRVHALVSPDYYGLGYEALRQALLAQAGRGGATGEAPTSAENASSAENALSAGNTSVTEGETPLAEQNTAAAEALIDNNASAVASAPSAASAVASAPSAASASVADVADARVAPGGVVRVQVLPRIIRRENLKAYAEQWERWLAQPM